MWSLSHAKSGEYPAKPGEGVPESWGLEPELGRIQGVIARMHLKERVEQPDQVAEACHGQRIAPRHQHQTGMALATEQQGFMQRSEIPIVGRNHGPSISDRPGQHLFIRPLCESSFIHCQDIVASLTKLLGDPSTDVLVEQQSHIVESASRRRQAASASSPIRRFWSIHPSISAL